MSDNCLQCSPNYVLPPRKTRLHMAAKSGLLRNEERLGANGACQRSRVHSEAPPTLLQIKGNQRTKQQDCSESDGVLLGFASNGKALWGL